ncbi:hypothetical protein Trydic_g15508 [Trypoxylus dichotomus]
MVQLTWFIELNTSCLSEPKAKPHEPDVTLRKIDFNRPHSAFGSTRPHSRFFKTIFLAKIMHVIGKEILIGDNFGTHFEQEVLYLATKKMWFSYIFCSTVHICYSLDMAFFRALE